MAELDCVCIRIATISGRIRHVCVYIKIAAINIRIRLCMFIMIAVINGRIRFIICVYQDCCYQWQNQIEFCYHCVCVNSTKTL